LPCRDGGAARPRSDSTERGKAAALTKRRARGILKKAHLRWSKGVDGERRKRTKKGETLRLRELSERYNLGCQSRGRN